MEQNKAITGSVWIEKVLHCVAFEGPGTMPPTAHTHTHTCQSAATCLAPE